MYNRSHRVIYSFSALFCLLTLLASQCILISVILLSLPPALPLCQAQVWLFNIGFSVAFSSIFAKVRTYYYQHSTGQLGGAEGPTVTIAKHNHAHACVFKRSVCVEY